MLTGIFICSLLFSSVYGASCPNNCNWDEEFPHGNCGSDGTCSCTWGYYDNEDDPVKDCSERFVITYSSEWTAIRSIFGACFGIVMLVSAVGAFFGNAKQNNVAPVANLKPLVLGLNSFMCFTQLLWIAIDPKAFDKVLPRAATYVLEGAPYWLGTGIYFAVLFHWVDIYYISISSIKLENMLKSINMNYRGREITIEEVTTKVKFLRKLRLPFSLIFLSVMVFQLVMSILRGLLIKNLALYFYIYLGLIWVCLSIGFLVYGRKLAAILPAEISKKIRRMTRRVTVFVVSIIVVIITMIVVSYGININSPTRFAWFFAVIELSVLGVAIVAIGLYARFNKSFPFIFKPSTKTTSQNSTKVELSVQGGRSA